MIMSFGLVFYNKIEDRGIVMKRNVKVVEQVMTWPHMRALTKLEDGRKSHSLLLEYYNEETKTIFRIGIDFLKTGEIYENNLCDHIGLNMEMNYSQTSAGAREAMELAIELQDKFDLLIFNWQDFSNTPPKPRKYSVDELMDNWNKMNEIIGNLVANLGDGAGSAQRKK